jgi:hypothetical protein
MKKLKNIKEKALSQLTFSIAAESLLVQTQPEISQITTASAEGCNHRRLQAQ